jgi:hypothetical protein
VYPTRRQKARQLYNVIWFGFYTLTDGEPLMNTHRTLRFSLSLALALFLSATLFAQRTADKTLVVNGKTATARVRQIDGHSYVDIESLAQATNAVFTVEPHRIVLTIPSAEPAPQSAAAPVAAPPPATVAAEPTPALSREFRSAAIAELSEMREWRGAVRAMILYGLAVSDTWVQSYQDQVQAGLQQATVVATTQSDQSALQLLRNEAENLTSWANGVYAARKALNGASTVDPNALQNDQALAKIRSCGQFLNSMIVTGTFADDASCH